MTAAWTPTDREVTVFLRTDPKRVYCGRLVTLDGDGVTVDLDPDPQWRAVDLGDVHPLTGDVTNTPVPAPDRVTVTWPEVDQVQLSVVPPPVRVPLATTPEEMTP